MSKQYLVRRLSWYYPTERFNACFFSALGLWVVWRYPLREVVLLVYGLCVMVSILFQGQRYWQLKLHRLQGKPIDQNASLSFFRGACRLNIVLIVAMPLVLALQFALLDWKVGSTSIMLYALAANVFAILEHINYYNRQLSIDNLPDVNYLRRHPRLKIAQLARDLKRGEI